MTRDMNTPASIRVQLTPQSREIHTARRVLARLTVQPGLHGPRAAVALAVVDTVYPPYAPVEELPADIVVPLTLAVEALRAAIMTATTLADAIRLGQAALELPAQDAA